MAEEDFNLVPYTDISELKKEIEGIKGKKDVSAKEIYDVVQKLAHTVTEMLEVFGAAAEQMKLEEKGYESENKKYEMIISKLDKILGQNRTIAEGMVAIVETLKEKSSISAKEKEEPQLFNQKKGKEENIFSQNPEQPMFSKPAQPQWPPAPQPMMPKMQQPMPQPNSPMIPPPLPMPAMAPPSPSLDFGMDMPSMEPAQPPDLDFPEELAPEAESKKKGLFGMFKK